MERIEEKQNIESIIFSVLQKIPKIPNELSIKVKKKLIDDYKTHKLNYEDLKTKYKRGLGTVSKTIRDIIF